jgi:O-antigen ligase
MAPATPDPKRHTVLTAAWSWLRATIDDPNRIAWLYIPVLGFLPLTFGSTATFFYFGACIYVGLIFVARRITWVWPPTTAFGCLVTLGYFVVTLISPLAFPHRAEGWLDVGTAMHYLTLTMLVGTLVQTPKVDVFDLFLNGARAAAIVSFGHALVQVFVFGASRATAGMANAIPFGDTAALAAGLSMVGFARLSPRMRLFALAALLCGIGGTFLSQTRGALLALPLIAVVVAVHLWPMIRMRLWQTGLLAAAVAASLVAFAIAVKVPERIDEVRQALESETLARHRDPSTAHRVVLWTYGLDAFLESPLLGYGSQNAVDEVRERAARDGFDIPPLPASAQRVHLDRSRARGGGPRRAAHPAAGADHHRRRLGPRWPLPGQGGLRGAAVGRLCHLRPDEPPVQPRPDQHGLCLLLPRPAGRRPPVAGRAHGVQPALPRRAAAALTTAGVDHSERWLWRLARPAARS